MATTEVFKEINPPINPIEDSYFPVQNRVTEEPIYFPRSQSYSSAPIPVSNREQTNPSQKSGFFSKVKSMINEIIAPPVISSAAEEFHKKLLLQCDEFIPNFGKNLLKNMVEEAKEKKKFLLMYIDSIDTPIGYTKEILCNELSVMIMNEFYVCWGVDRETHEGEMAAIVLNASIFPCLAAVKCNDPSGPMVIEKIEGIHTAEKIIEFLSRNYVARPVINKRDKIIEEERKIRANQDRELKEAERELKERHLAESRKKEETKKQLELEKLRIEKIENEKKIKEQSIGIEPEGPDAALVSFRLPNGNKIERKFDKNRNIQILYDYLEVQGLNNYVILFGFPSVPLTDKDQTLETAGIFPKAVVIVRNS